MCEKYSKVGIASFVIATVVALLLLGAFATAGMLQRGHRPGDYPGNEIVGLAVIALLFADVVALTLGVISVAQKEHKRLFGILGLSISGVTVLGTIALIVIGLIIMFLKR